MEADGAAIISGNTDVAVADFDYAPRSASHRAWATTVPEIFRAAAEWAHDELGDERLAWLRRLPSERRLHRRGRDDDPGLPRLAGLADRRLRPAARPERRHRAGRGRTPGSSPAATPTPGGARPRLEDDRQRRLGRLRRSMARRPRPGRASTSPTARSPPRSIAPSTTPSPWPTRSPPAACRATSIGRRRSAPGSWSDERRAAPRRRHRDGPGHRARQRRAPRPGPGWSPAGPASGRSRRSTRRGSTSRIAGEVHDFDASGVLDRKELRRTDRYIQFGLVAAREALDQAGLPERFEGELAERTGVILGTGLGGVGTLIDGFTTNATARPRPDQPVPHPDGHPQHRRRPGRHPASG